MSNTPILEEKRSQAFEESPYETLARGRRDLAAETSGKQCTNWTHHQSDSEEQ